MWYVQKQWTAWDWEGRHVCGVFRNHDNVGIVRGQNEELYEDPVWPVVVASRLVQSCNLVVFVQGSQAPATRGKDGTERVLRFRTLFENCVKAGDWLTW